MPVTIDDLVGEVGAEAQQKIEAAGGRVTDTIGPEKTQELEQEFGRKPRGRFRIDLPDGTERGEREQIGDSPFDIQITYTLPGGAQIRWQQTGFPEPATSWIAVL